MKIKFKETQVPHVTNITFEFSLSKQFTKKINPTTTSSKLEVSDLKRFPMCSFTNQIQQNRRSPNLSLLIKYNSFIPRNPNMKSVILAHDRKAKTIKSLQSAKQVQKRLEFPVRKVLTKASTMSSFYKKSKVFQFQNPQIDFFLFQNKSISNSFARSNSSFNSKPKLYQEVRTDNFQQEKRTDQSGFKRYDMPKSLSSSTASLSLGSKNQISQNFRSKRISNPVI